MRGTVTNTTIRLDRDDWDRPLCCPICGTDYIHQGKVTVFSRSEDDATVTVCEVGGEQALRVSEQPSKTAGNPSARRHGLTIGFRCEECAAAARVGGEPDYTERFELCITQHKGMTYMRWRLIEAKKG